MADNYNYVSSGSESDPEEMTATAYLRHLDLEIERTKKELAELKEKMATSKGKEPMEPAPKRARVEGHEETLCKLENPSARMGRFR